MRSLTRDGRLLFAARMARLFAYGSLSVILALYLTTLGLSEWQVGLLFSLTLFGDTAVSLFLTTRADRYGRKRMLTAGAGLMIAAGLVFALTRDPILLTIAATVGVISPSGNEVGPFLSIEQAALSQLLPDERRTGVFAWYNLAGSFSTAFGALAGGGLVQGLQGAGVQALSAYRGVVTGYALFGLLLLGLFRLLSPAVEAPPVVSSAGSDGRAFLGLGRSREIVLKLAGLFALDAFAGGFVIQSLTAYWFHVRFGVEAGALGGIFWAANLLAGVSALSAAAIARRIGLIRTMVFTHLPSNVMLMLVPFMPGLVPAVVLLLARYSISQMDVPTRQSYLMAVVSPGERAAAAGVTGIARSLGAAISPLIAGSLLASPALLSAPFVISGGLKVVYDLLLYRSFQAARPPEEQRRN
jgi:MFS family permease